VQVAPIKPMLKAPATKRLTPVHDKLLSNLAFKYNLRLYTEGPADPVQVSELVFFARLVRRCRLTL